MSISNEIYIKDEPLFDPEEYDQVCSLFLNLQKCLNIKMLQV